MPKVKLDFIPHDTYPYKVYELLEEDRWNFYSDYTSKEQAMQVAEHLSLELTGLTPETIYFENGKQVGK